MAAREKPIGNPFEFPNLIADLLFELASVEHRKQQERKPYYGDQGTVHLSRGQEALKLKLHLSWRLDDSHNNSRSESHST